MPIRNTLRASLIAAAILAPAAALAQEMRELDRVFATPDPAAELTQSFNDLISSVVNIAPAGSLTGAALDADRAKAKEMRAKLQNFDNLGKADDKQQRMLAKSGPAYPQIDALAAKLDQGIGTRLSTDARAGLVRDFKTVAEFMAVIEPAGDWYCQFNGLKPLLGC
jgi:hypothetical protein